MRVGGGERGNSQQRGGRSPGSVGSCAELGSKKNSQVVPAQVTERGLSKSPRVTAKGTIVPRGDSLF